MSNAADPQDALVAQLRSALEGAYFLALAWKTYYESAVAYGNGTPDPTHVRIVRDARAALEATETGAAKEAAELAAAVDVLLDNNVGDFVYAIRERELEGWEGPRVKAWGEACATIVRIRKGLS